MNDEIKLRQRLRGYVADEPAARLTFEGVVTAGRRSRRRRRVAGASCLAVGALVAGSIGGYAIEPGSDDLAHESTPPSDPTPATEPTKEPTVPGPDVLARVVTKHAGHRWEWDHLAASTWKAFDLDRRQAPPELAPRNYAGATEWDGSFLNDRADVSDIRYLNLRAEHQPPDVSEDEFREDCTPDETVPGPCEHWQLDDGRQVMEAYEELPASGVAAHRVAVFGKGFQVWAEEYYPAGAGGLDPDEFRLSTDQLVAIASDQALVFPAPDPLPPLPSYQRCTLDADSGDPAPGCTGDGSNWPKSSVPTMKHEPSTRQQELLDAFTQAIQDRLDDGTAEAHELVLQDGTRLGSSNLEDAVHLRVDVGDRTLTGLFTRPDVPPVTATQTDCANYDWPGRECRSTPVDGGLVLVVSSLHDTEAIFFRDDGTQTRVTQYTFDPENPNDSGPPMPLTEDELISLVQEPSLDYRG